MTASFFQPTKICSTLYEGEGRSSIHAFAKPIMRFSVSRQLSKL